MTSVTDMIDAPLLKIVAPNNSELSAWAPAIRAACSRYNINTVRQVASFIAQASHESGGYRVLVENLNYRAERLVQVWPSRFRNVQAAASYANNPEKLANLVYANRMGNGDERSGDGFKFRGRGLIQLTGRDNYRAFANSIGKSIDDVPAYMETKDGAAMSAAWFFDSRGIGRLAETPGVEDETRAINGGVNGLEERRALFNAVVAELLKRGA